MIIKIKYIIVFRFFKHNLFNSEKNFKINFKQNKILAYIYLRENKNNKDNFKQDIIFIEYNKKQE